MTPTEILELMRLKDWTQTELAAALGLSQYAVQTWLSKNRRPSGPASILMRQWLDKARAEATGAEHAAVPLPDSSAADVPTAKTA